MSDLDLKLEFKQAWLVWSRAPATSARGLLFWAGRLVLLFGVLHVFGCRSYSTAISGVEPSATGVLHGLLGVAYMVSYLACVLLAPALAMASAVVALAERVWMEIAHSRR
jgi:hypothetical protein